MNPIFITIILSILPISELRGAIPYALAKGINPAYTYLLSTIPNILVIFIILLFLDYFHKYLMQFYPYKKLFIIYLNRIRNKVDKKIVMVPFVVLFFFVAIPFPGTGAYTGCLITWFFKLNRKKAIPTMAFAVAIAGLIVIFASLSAITFFYK
ncbi:MAG: small multi-drug export protein [Nanoarchaeota archaeon]|nr:small multi-drug export protein [Nanoarchaeota archaeon]